MLGMENEYGKIGALCMDSPTWWIWACGLNSIKKCRRKVQAGTRKGFHVHQTWVPILPLRDLHLLKTKTELMTCRGRLDAIL